MVPSCAAARRKLSALATVRKHADASTPCHAPWISSRRGITVAGLARGRPITGHWIPWVQGLLTRTQCHGSGSRSPEERSRERPPPENHPHIERRQATAQQPFTTRPGKRQQL